MPSAKQLSASTRARTKANNVYDHWGQSLSFLERSPADGRCLWFQLDRLNQIYFGICGGPSVEIRVPQGEHCPALPASAKIWISSSAACPTLYGGEDEGFETKRANARLKLLDGNSSALIVVVECKSDFESDLVMRHPAVFDMAACL